MREIAKAYAKYKHMEKIFQDPFLQDGDAPRTVIGELWLAIKKDLGVK